MSIRHQWKFDPPTGSWFRIPGRDDSKIVVDVFWRDAEEADIAIDGVKQTVSCQELDDLYMQATYVSLPLRVVQIGRNKDGTLARPFTSR
jgi:hypothetical protein